MVDGGLDGLQARDVRDVAGLARQPLLRHVHVPRHSHTTQRVPSCLHVMVGEKCQPRTRHGHGRAHGPRHVDAEHNVACVRTGGGGGGRMENVVLGGAGWQLARVQVARCGAVSERVAGCRWHAPFGWLQNSQVHTLSRTTLMALSTAPHCTHATQSPVCTAAPSPSVLSFTPTTLVSTSARYDRAPAVAAFLRNTFRAPSDATGAGASPGGGGAANSADAAQPAGR